MTTRRSLPVAATLLIAALGATASPAAAAKVRAPCVAKGATIVARSGSAVLYRRSVGSGSEYGRPERLVGCASRTARPRTLATFGDTAAVTVTAADVEGTYAAYALSVTDVSCTKYQPGPECTLAGGVRVVDLATGAKTIVLPGGATGIAVTARGALAWLPTATGPLFGVGSAGPTVLDAGPVEAGSLVGGASGVSWRSGGAPHSAAI